MSTTPQKLYLFQVATLPLPSGDIPAVCYLVQTNDGKNILIDSGLPADLQPPPGLNAPIMGKDVIEQLALLGLQPEDIHLLICTHFDPDHAGRHGAFRHAELVVQMAHYEQALHDKRFAVTRSQWNYPGARYRFVDGDFELCPGLELIETTGHRRGHQSVLVRLPQTGPVLLAIDAVAEQGSFTPERQASFMDDDEVPLRASTRKLLDIVKHEQVALVIFGHDGQQWQQLKKAPAYYG